MEIKKELDATLKKELGSKIKDISDSMPVPKLILANGKRVEFSEISQNIATSVKDLSFLNEQISHYSNQLQVLDTARITYSKTFYETLTGENEN